MTGPGSGTGSSTWLHEPLAGKVASAAPIIDVLDVSLAQQQEMLLHARDAASRLAKQQRVGLAAAHRNLTAVINFESKKLDASEGNMRSLAHYACVPRSANHPQAQAAHLACG